MEETYKRIAVDFFRYWWNTSGTNTDQGFDDWWSKNKDNYLQPIKEITDDIEKLKNKVKNQVGKAQPSGFKLLTNYYPNDAKEQIDDIFKIIESNLITGAGKSKDAIIQKQEELIEMNEAYIQKMNDASKLARIHDNELAQELWREAIEMRAKILILRSELEQLKGNDH